MGLWEGVQPLDVDALGEDEQRRIEEEGEREESIQRRVGAGLWGAALPAASERVTTCLSSRLPASAAVSTSI